MANRSFALIRGGAAGVIAASLLLPLLWVSHRADGLTALRPSDLQALWFTLWQAAVSAGLSCALAIPVARALARRRFWGRRGLILLLGAPFILPVIVAILGLTAVFGRTGLLNQAFGILHMPEVSIYGPQGVILAHVFFNMPLATRLILQGWNSIPAERFRTGASLGFSHGAIFRHIELPMLARVLPGLFVVIFLICTTSFAVALTLGGGPRATTLELALYQTFRFAFDLPQVAMLALCQLGLGLVACFLALYWRLPENFGPGLDRAQQHWGIDTIRLRLLDTVVICLVTAFLLTPLLMVFVQGVIALFDLPSSVWQAALRSLVIAFLSTALTLSFALIFAMTVAQTRTAWAYETLALTTLSVSPLVLGAGYYLMLVPVTNPIAWALPITIWVNMLLSLPFAVRALVPEVRILRKNYTRLSQSLGLNGTTWLRWVAWPRLRRPIGFAAGLSAALSAGDLGVIALFATPDQATLPLQIYQLMAAYRLEDAMGAAVLLMLMSLSLFWLFDRGGRHDTAG